MYYGGFWRRAGAHIVDLVIFFGSILVIAALGLALLGGSGDVLGQIVPQIVGEFKYLIGTFAGLCVALYDGGDYLGDVFQQAFRHYPSEIYPPLTAYWLDVVMMATFCLHAALWESSRFQATPGKLLFGLKVVHISGQKLSFLRALARHILMFLNDLTLGIGYLFMLVTRRKQGLHDKLARALVINKFWHDPHW